MIRKKIRKLICSIIGHNYINLHRKQWDNKYTGTTTGWKCQRCNHTTYEQWDQ